MKEEIKIALKKLGIIMLIIICVICVGLLSLPPEGCIELEYNKAMTLPLDYDIDNLRLNVRGERMPLVYDQGEALNYAKNEHSQIIVNTGHSTLLICENEVEK